MPEFPRALALSAALVIAAAGGCARPAARTLPPAAAPAPPAALGTLETDAQAAIGSASTRDWSAVSSELAGIRQAWSALRPEAAARGARPGLLDSIDGAITELTGQADGLSPGQTALAANQLTAYVPDLMALYASPVPPQLVEMGYLAREVVMDVDGGRPGAVWSEARTLDTQWAFVRPAAQRIDMSDASRLDRQLAALAAASAPTAAGTGTAAPAGGAAAVLDAAGAAQGSIAALQRAFRTQG